MLGRLAVPKIIYVRPVGSPENTSNTGENPNINNLARPPRPSPEPPRRFFCPKIIYGAFSGLRKNHIKILKSFQKPPGRPGVPGTPGRCPGKNALFCQCFYSIVSDSKSLGRRPVDPCLSRRASQGHPASVPRIFLQFMSLKVCFSRKWLHHSKNGSSPEPCVQSPCVRNRQIWEVRKEPSRPYRIAGEIRVIFSRLSDRTRSRDQISIRSRAFFHSCNLDRALNALIWSVSQLRSHYIPASKIDKKPTPVQDISGKMTGFRSRIGSRKSAGPKRGCLNVGA